MEKLDIPSSQLQYRHQNFLSLLSNQDEFSPSPIFLFERCFQNIEDHTFPQQRTCFGLYEAVENFPSTKSNVRLYEREEKKIFFVERSFRKLDILSEVISDNKFVF
jgi:hypothetical protein